MGERDTEGEKEMKIPKDPKTQVPKEVPSTKLKGAVWTAAWVIFVLPFRWLKTFWRAFRKTRSRAIPIDEYCGQVEGSFRKALKEMQAAQADIARIAAREKLTEEEKCGSSDRRRNEHRS